MFAAAVILPSRTRVLLGLHPSRGLPLISEMPTPPPPSSDPPRPPQVRVSERPPSCQHGVVGQGSTRHPCLHLSLCLHVLPWPPPSYPCLSPDSLVSGPRSHLDPAGGAPGTPSAPSPICLPPSLLRHDGSPQRRKLSACRQKALLSSSGGLRHDKQITQPWEEGSPLGQ